MLSRDLKRLHRVFDAWISGTGPKPGPGHMREFRRQLQHCIAKAALLELGVDSAVFDEAMFGAAPAGPNVIPFPQHRSRERLGCGDPKPTTTKD